MNKNSYPYRQGTARASVELLAECFAPDEFFLPWENVPDELKEDCEINGAVPCDGSGSVGLWCNECRFGNVEE